jgi:hypothetical protein
MPRAWYAYDGIGDPYLLSSYSLVTANIGCQQGSTPCAVYIDNADLDPKKSFSINIKHYISNLLVTGVGQPQIGSKKYVYGRD